jgi:DNA-binding NtrC family response regulator
MVYAGCVTMKRRILIVDDESEIRSILKDYLEDLGEVIGVESGDQAVRALEQGRCDLIISDYNMPGMNGLELLRHLNSQGGNIPLIWITGRSSKDLVVEAWKEGVFDYFEKPFDLEQIRKSVITALSLADPLAGQGGTRERTPWTPELDPGLEAPVRLRAGEVGLEPSEYLCRLIRKDLGIIE